jgi:hypothetical protein
VRPKPSARLFCTIDACRCSALTHARRIAAPASGARSSFLGEKMSMVGGITAVRDRFKPSHTNASRENTRASAGST